MVSISDADRKLCSRQRCVVTMMPRDKSVGLRNRYGLKMQNTHDSPTAQPVCALVFAVVRLVTFDSELFFLSPSTW